MPPFTLDPTKDIIPAPDDPSLWPAYRDQLHAWRAEIRRTLKFDDSLYRKPEFAWAASAYCSYFLMMCDEAFYNAASGRYTVDALLDLGERDFGGFDSVVLWHAYPRIGLDARNQFDFYRDMPGGLPGLREVVAAFHRRNVRVYIDYNPWDTGTRREDKSDIDALADIIRAIDADGLYLDTMTNAADGVREKLDAIRPGLILESEVTPPLERIADHHASWAQWFTDSPVPGVLRHKWMERRHMQHLTDRWNPDHSAELHTAWMNGTGIVVWDNVFGSASPWKQRDCSLLRAMLPIQRRYTALFSGESWMPLVPTSHPGVYASLWTDGDLSLWTLVNRSDNSASGPLLRVTSAPGVQYCDLISGTALPKPSLTNFAFTTTIPPRGIACLLAAPVHLLGGDFPKFLAAQAAIHARANFDATKPRLEMQSRPVTATRKLPAPPSAMVASCHGGSPWLYTHIRVRECGFFDSNITAEPDLKGTWQWQIKEFKRPFTYHPYAIDETPVTNAQFAEFLVTACYHPGHPENFLRHWQNGQPPAGKLDHPVVWVDIDDARAYATWAGKRLLTDDEWQYAAQAGSGLEYPWGNGLGPGLCNLGSETTPVKAFPDGRSPWGCYDMCGNVWEWTDSVTTDGRTRYCLIRGGSCYTAAGSAWYMDGGVRPAGFAAKFLLMWPSLDRCGTIGFRCAADLE